VFVKKYSDSELIKILDIDKKTLDRLKQIQTQTIKEAKALFSKKKGKIKVVGISGSARDEFDLSQENSNSEELLKVALDECKKLGANVELIQLRKFEIKPCKACYSTTNTHCHYPCSCYPKGTPQGDDMTNILYQKIIDADAIIFATPVNNFKVSSFMSLFIDRCISLDGSLSPADKDNPKNKALNIKHTKFVELSSDQKVLGSGFFRRFAGKVAGVIVTGHEEGASMAISSIFMTMSHWGMIFPPYGNMYAMSSISSPTDKDKSMVLSELFKKDARFVANNVMQTAQLVRNNKSKWAYDYSVN
jgi:multimeric flavodoxin WrbA